MNDWLQRTADDPKVAQQLKVLLENGYLGEDHPAVVVHDLGKLKRRLEPLRQTFPKGSLHTVAVKSNPLLRVLECIVKQGFGLEVASAGELALAQAAGCPGERIVFDSPAKTMQELQAAFEQNVVVNANSSAELERLATIGWPERLGLRCNPLVADQSRASTTMVATPNSKFGISFQDAAQILLDFPEVNGLHVHVGSQVATCELLVEACRRLVEFAQGFPQIQWLDIGGGLPTRYCNDDKGLSPEVYLSELRRAAPGLEQFQIITEVGRALQAGCGWAASVVEYVVPGEASLEQSGRLIVHLGADFALRECYEGRKWWHDFELYSSTGLKKTGPLSSYDIFGPLCFSGDRLVSGCLLPEAEPGDILLMHDCGAYTLSMWSRYCSRLIPEVVGFDGDSFSVLRAREKSADLVSFWS